ncbi:hypothetical protein [Streptomyces cuspidosporus]|uniref:hypothetical protein n=1 Tax=Streptomyces cuspidosporus TaxID=66882 RepID=UPI0031FC71B5
MSRTRTARQAGKRKPANSRGGSAGAAARRSSLQNSAPASGAAARQPRTSGSPQPRPWD